MPQQPSSESTIATKCPGCAKTLKLTSDLVGRKVKCPNCQQVFSVRSPPAPTQPGGACVICQCPIQPSDSQKQCSGCSGMFHSDCWEYNHGCGVYGCEQAPPTEGLNTLEIPPSFWGQEDKECPSCREIIKAAALRCRHCGVTFETSNPQSSAEYRSHENKKESLYDVKAMAIVLLVFGLTPCTAPFVALGGPYWYRLHREKVALLPGFHSALCKIGIGASIVVTLLSITFTVLSLVMPT